MGQKDASGSRTTRRPHQKETLWDKRTHRAHALHADRTKKRHYGTKGRMRLTHYTQTAPKRDTMGQKDASRSRTTRRPHQKETLWDKRTHRAHALHADRTKKRHYGTKGRMRLTHYTQTAPKRDTMGQKDASGSRTTRRPHQKETLWDKRTLAAHALHAERTKKRHYGTKGRMRLTHYTQTAPTRDTGQKDAAGPCYTHTESYVTRPSLPLCSNESLPRHHASPPTPDIHAVFSTFRTMRTELIRSQARKGTETVKLLQVPRGLSPPLAWFAKNYDWLSFAVSSRMRCVRLASCEAHCAMSEYPI